jgi:hypothetical protein
MPNRYDGLLKQAAPAIAARGPEVVLLDDQTTHDVRVIRLRIASSRQAPIVSIFATVTTLDLKATVDGKSIGDSVKPTMVDGIELMLRMKTPQPLKLTVTDRSYGLPQVPQMSTTYPVDAMPAPVALSDTTSVTRRFTF